jgi:hypothetical protein
MIADYNNNRSKSITGEMTMEKLLKELDRIRDRALSEIRKHPLDEQWIKQEIDMALMRAAKAAYDSRGEDNA